MTLSCVWGGGGWDESGREQKVSKRNVFEMCVCVSERERERDKIIIIIKMII